MLQKADKRHTSQLKFRKRLQKMKLELTDEGWVVVNQEEKVC